MSGHVVQFSSIEFQHMYIKNNIDILRKILRSRMSLITPLNAWFCIFAFLSQETACCTAQRPKPLVMEPLRLLSFFTLLALLSAHPRPQFGFLGNFLGGFLGNRGQAGSSSGGSSGGGCGGGHRPNHQFGGQNFLVS